MRAFSLSFPRKKKYFSRPCGTERIEENDVRLKGFFVLASGCEGASFAQRHIYVILYFPEFKNGGKYSEH